MYLFARTGLANRERAPEAMAFAVDIAGYVSQATGLEVITWATVYGAPLGTISWSARVESQAAMGEASEKLLADGVYQDRLKEAAGLFEGHPSDTISQFVAFAGTGGNIGRYASLVRANCAPGKIAAAMAWGVDVMNHVHSITGRDLALVRSMYGPWAGLGWISMADSLADVDAANDAMAADASYVERLDQGGELFVAGSADQVLLQRLA